MTKRTIMLRLVIDDPLPGVTYSLQDKKSSPVSAVVADEAPLSFEVPINVAPGSKLSGDFVRREGTERRFVYIASGGQAGDPASEWSRRAKIEVHDLPSNLLEEAGASKGCCQTNQRLVSSPLGVSSASV
jgi:hypothetical protein